MDKMSSTQLDKYTMQWVNNWLSALAQRVIVNGVTSGWQPVSSVDQQGYILGSALFHVFINDLGACIVSKLAEDTKLGGAAYSLEG